MNQPLKMNTVFDMTDIITDSFKTTLTIMRYIGLFYDEKQAKILKIWSLSLYLSVVLGTTLAFVGFLTQKTDDIMQINQMVVFLVSSAAICVKVLLFLVNGSRMKKCIEYFGDHRFAPKTNEEKIIIDDCHRVCKRNFRIYGSILFVADICWNILPFFEKKPRLPINIWLPYEITIKPAIFYTTYFYVVTVMIYFGVVTTMLEPLLGGLAYHATSQLKILKHNLSSLDKYRIPNDYDCFSGYGILSKALKQCIVRHNNILEFIMEYENCFSWCTFCQIAGTTIGLGFCCIGLTMVSPTSVNAVMFVMSYVVISFQLFFYCHYGTLLYEENEKLMSAIYMNSWYEYDVTVRKILLIIMERSKSQITLTAGRVIELKYQTFISLALSFIKFKVRVQQYLEGLFLHVMVIGTECSDEKTNTIKVERHKIVWPV
ncbi:odorant receptor 94b-like [Zophobas morio]|uniref:odorant receptor 94b-like n=1 Tax=Zophobas morio TaxID=2755281 RepID=UPI003083E7FF